MRLGSGSEESVDLFPCLVSLAREGRHTSICGSDANRRSEDRESEGSDGGIRGSDRGIENQKDRIEGGG